MKKDCLLLLVLVSVMAGLFLHMSCTAPSMADPMAKPIIGKVTSLHKDSIGVDNKNYRFCNDMKIFYSKKLNFENQLNLAKKVALFLKDDCVNMVIVLEFID